MVLSHVEPQSAELAVVVISVGAPPELAQAVRSLVDQSVPLEIVVVNSGGGRPAERLSAFGDRIRIVTCDELLWPGAARNVGVAETTAPYVAFLASDCLALAGWAENRIAHHKRGAAAVASALVNDRPRNVFAAASHLALFARRLPGAPPHIAHRYGLSYARDLLHRHGVFLEDVRTGEDTEFAARIAPGHKPIWAPEILTAHRSPTTFTAMIADQYRRGARTTAALAALGQKQPNSYLRYAWRRLVDCVNITRQVTRGKDRRFASYLLPIVAICIAAYVYGMARGSAAKTDCAKPSRDPLASVR